ncbi:hypothetical protein H5410_014141 [Solanum commersonii]|uniref:Uncharacterized protein n=1 Tax=Solanum commersonii TaxID=4109 RepID=A0A9J5ZQ29_SOLCO|nr:hypothetical protein H5410_014141 [Solanum commersonii]
MAYSSAVNAKDTVEGKVSDAYNQTIKMATDRSTIDAKDSTRDALVERKDKVDDNYEDAKSKAYETYESAKDTMNEQAKEKYEDAKEKASDAAGNLGQKMRTATPYRSSKLLYPLFVNPGAAYDIGFETEHANCRWNGQFNLMATTKPEV